MQNMRVATALLSLAPFLAGAAEIPRPAPDLQVSLPDGKTLDLKQYRGKVVCVAFILTT